MTVNLQGIQTVLLDMDGTLLDLHFDNDFWQTYVYQVYSDKHQIEFSETKHLLDPEFTSRRGTLDWYSVNFWSEKLGLDIMDLKRQVVDKIAYRPQAKEFLQRCGEEIPDVRLITNGHRRVLDLKLEYTQLDQYFDSMICSHELGAPKEQQRFWQELQALQGFDPETTIFIDDSEAVLDSAYQFGIKHLYNIARPDSNLDRERQSKYKLLEAFI